MRPYRTIIPLTAADVLEIIDALGAAGVDVWVDGGWGVDALLGRQTREHADLDVALDRELLPTVRDALQMLGFTEDTSAEPGLPARLVLVDRAGRQVDVHPLRVDARGNGWQQLSAAGDAWGAYPAEHLAATGSIAGRAVRCLSPELQLEFHRGFEWTAAHERDVRLLSETFGLPIPGAPDAEGRDPPS